MDSITENKNKLYLNIGNNQIDGVYKTNNILNT